MKGIVIIDIPENCKQCIFQKWSKNVLECGVSGCIVLNQNKKPEWCPIKPVPDKKKVHECFMYGEIYGEEIGWNSCIDEILKGE